MIGLYSSPQSSRGLIKHMWVETRAVSWLDNSDRPKPTETIPAACKKNPNKCHQKLKHSSAGRDKSKPQTRFVLSSQTHWSEARHPNVWNSSIEITAFWSPLKSSVTNKNSCDCRGTSVGLREQTHPITPIKIAPGEYAWGKYWCSI